jgi:hypothetical protein
MKKVLNISLLVIILLMTIKFLFSNYDIEYKVNDYTVREVYKNGYYYFEIKGEQTYNFDLFKNRSLSKMVIDSIEVLNTDTYQCIYPKIKGEQTYPLCYKNGKMIAYYLIDDPAINELVESLDIKYSNQENEKTFEFFNNLNDEEYIAVYKYNGFYILNGNKIKTVNLFEEDRYDNSLCLQMDNFLLLPEESEYTFSNFILLDMTNEKEVIIKGDIDISYDSIMLGYINNKAYILDNKTNIEYEIDIKKKTITEVGNSEKGYKVLKNNQLKTGMISELKNLKYLWTSETNTSLYTYKQDEGLYKYINKNTDIVEKIYNKEVQIIKENYRNLYFIDGYSLYSYDPLYGIKKIISNEEWDFNNTNVIFIFNNN